MKTLIQKAYALALEQMKLNWNELPGGASNPRITKAFSAVDGLGDPKDLDDSTTSWCSVVMNWLIQSVGGKGTRSALARSWLNWGKECYPVQGCIVILKRGDSSWQGHVAFFVKREDDYIWCLGGNQGNDFKMSKYKASDVLGYRTSKDTL